MENFYQGCDGAISPFAISDFDFSKGEYIAEQKYDGIWVNCHFDKDGKVTLWSRNVKEKDNKQLVSLREHLQEKLKLKDSVLVGELAFSSQAGTDLAKKLGHHKVDLFDVLKVNGRSLLEEKLLLRKGTLRDLLYDGGVDPSFAEMGWYQGVASAGRVEELYKDVVARGGEGLIIKDVNDEQYRLGGRSKLWYKIKKFLTNDYVIIGYTKTNSADFEQRGWIGGVVGGLYVDGKLVNKVTVGSMTFQWREEFSKNGDAYIGKVMEVGGFEIFKSGAMRHPSFIGMRPDKNPQECVWNA